jgi:hypothetical protein
MDFPMFFVWGSLFLSVLGFVLMCIFYGLAVLALIKFLAS